MFIEVKLFHMKKSIEEICREACNIMPECEYHNAEHAKRVSEEVNSLFEESSISSTNSNELTVAAHFHDTGHATGPTEGHEQRSCDIAEEHLTNAGYDQEFIEEVKTTIEGTVFLEEPSSESGKLLSDADVWNFGADWKTFIEKTLAVRREYAPDIDTNDWLWCRGRVLKSHTYYTDVGRQRYQKRKEENIDRIVSIYGPIEDAPQLFDKSGN